MFKNLKAEMVRKGITNETIAEILNINVCTVSAKLNSYNRLKFDEAKKIQQDLFPECTVDYLFATEWGERIEFSRSKRTYRL